MPDIFSEKAPIRVLTQLTFINHSAQKNTANETSGGMSPILHPRKGWVLATRQCLGSP